MMLLQILFYLLAGKLEKIALNVFRAVWITNVPKQMNVIGHDNETVYLNPLIVRQK